MKTQFPHHCLLKKALLVNVYFSIIVKNQISIGMEVCDPILCFILLSAVLHQYQAVFITTVL